MNNNNTPNPIKTLFEQKYKTQLSDVEVADYKDKLVRLFNLLIEIDQKNKGKEVANDDSQRDLQGKK